MLIVCRSSFPCIFLFFFNDTATTEIYTLSLHDALPILIGGGVVGLSCALRLARAGDAVVVVERRSEEHTSELQSQSNFVCRLLLEKKKKPLFRRNSRSPNILRCIDARLQCLRLARLEPS